MVQQQNRIDVIARITLKGQFGPIDGITCGEGIMVPLERILPQSVLNEIQRPVEEL